jgi:circadian clock protein KaiC
MTERDGRAAVEKLPTGIEGFDLIALGGLPKGRATLVSGTAGSAKTVFAVQFLAEGILRTGESGVFVTFEEAPADIRRNMLSMGWDIAAWEAEGRWAFVDASAHLGDEVVEIGSYDFGGLLARIEHAIRKVGATRVSVDSLGAVFSHFRDEGAVRRELFRLALALKDLGVTALLTAERGDEHGSLARFGVEEFVADNVIVLRNILEDEKRRRTVEILKFRGTAHQRGEFPFTVRADGGIVVIPLSAMELKQKSSYVRISSGNEALDAICGGGFFRDSIILVSGATGTGKTLTVTHFLDGGAQRGDRCLLFGYEESREQLFRNASGWNVDFEAMEREGTLRVHCEYPEMRGLEDHLLRIKKAVEEFQPQRVAVDSLSALERVGPRNAFRQLVIGLTSFIKDKSITGLFTNTTPTLVGGTSVTETHISSLTDTIILLRYVEMFGEMRRGIMVLKMRGSPHDKDIRELTIDGSGMHLGAAFRSVSGLLSGNPVHVSPELTRLEGLFPGE